MAKKTGSFDLGKLADELLKGPGGGGDGEDASETIKRLTAHIKKLSAALKLGKAEVKKLGAEYRKVADQALKLIDGQADLINKANTLEQANKKLKTQVTKLSNEKKKLKDRITDLNQKLKENKEQTTKSEKENKKLEKSIFGLQRGNRNLSSSFSVLRSQMLIVSFGMRTFQGVVKSLIDEQIEMEGAQSRLQAALNTTGHQTNETVESLSKYASALQDTTGVSDGLMVSNMAFLTTFTNIKGTLSDGTSVFRKAAETVLDLTAAASQGRITFETLRTNTTQLGKALNDPIKGMTALSKAGTTFDDSTKSLVKTLVLSGNLLGAQELILKEINKQYSGTAGIDSYEKRSRELGSAVGDLQKKIGKLLLPGVKEVQRQMINLVKSMDVGKILSFGTAIAAASATVYIIVPRIIAMHKAMVAAGSAAAMFTGGAKAIQTVLKLLAAVIGTVVIDAFFEWIGVFGNLDDALEQSEKRITEFTEKAKEMTAAERAAQLDEINKKIKETGERLSNSKQGLEFYNQALKNNYRWQNLAFKSASDFADLFNKIVTGGLFESTRDQLQALAGASQDHVDAIQNQNDELLSNKAILQGMLKAFTDLTTKGIVTAEQALKELAKAYKSTTEGKIKYISEVIKEAENLKKIIPFNELQIKGLEVLKQKKLDLIKQLAEENDKYFEARNNLKELLKKERERIQLASELDDNKRLELELLFELNKEYETEAENLEDLAKLTESSIDDIKEILEIRRRELKVKKEIEALDKQLKESADKQAKISKVLGKGYRNLESSLSSILTIEGNLTDKQIALNKIQKENNKFVQEAVEAGMNYAVALDLIKSKADDTARRLENYSKALLGQRTKEAIVELSELSQSFQDEINLLDDDTEATQRNIDKRKRAASMLELINTTLQTKFKDLTTAIIYSNEAGDMNSHVLRNLVSSYEDIEYTVDRYNKAVDEKNRLEEQAEKTKERKEALNDFIEKIGDQINATRDLTDEQKVLLDVNKFLNERQEDSIANLIDLQSKYPSLSQVIQTYLSILKEVAEVEAGEERQDAIDKLIKSLDKMEDKIRDQIAAYNGWDITKLKQIREEQDLLGISFEDLINLFDQQHWLDDLSEMMPGGADSDTPFNNLRKQLELLNPDLKDLSDTQLKTIIEKLRAIKLANEEAWKIDQVEAWKDKMSEVSGVLSQLGSAWGGLSNAIEANMQQESDQLSAKERYNANLIENQVAREQEMARIDNLAMERQKDIAGKMKKYRIFEAMINTASAIITALAHPSGPPLSFTLAALAAMKGAVQLSTISNQTLAFAKGGSFETSGPQMIMVGDNMGGREKVDITPLSSPNIAGPSQSTEVIVNVSGNVMTQDFVEGDLADSIKKAIRRGSDFGIG